MTAPRCVWPVGALLGEGPVWDVRDNSIYFVDIKGSALHRFGLTDGARESWPMPEPLCWIIPRANAPGFVAGFKSGFGTIELAPLSITRMDPLEPDRPGNRLNDAKADRHGAIWAGSMHDAEEKISGALYHLDRDWSCRRVDDGYAVANGPTFSPDCSTLYHTDSGAGIVYQFDLDPAGALENKRVFVRFKDDWGSPDGMTVDEQGGVWIAHWGGARISRFAPDGALDRVIALPVSRPTSCVFAGADLTRMFVTSARIGTEGEALAGGLFDIEPGVRGAVAHSFAG